MITIHHLGVSQSDRIVWLMEELELPYEIQWYDRGDDFLAPQAYRDLHPVGTAPIITDGDLVLPESTAIVEYVSQRYADGKLSIGVDEADYPHYLFWLQFNASLQAGLFIRMAAQAGGAQDDGTNPLFTTVNRRIDGLYRALEERLAQHDYLAGDRFTCADIMTLFNLNSLEILGARPLAELPQAAAYVERLSTRPAYQRAMQIAGPDAARPD
ncbi:MAG: glutathione S-transferase family protein [Pseudomonadota bacterium]